MRFARIVVPLMVAAIVLVPIPAAGAQDSPVLTTRVQLSHPTPIDRVVADLATAPVASLRGTQRIIQFDHLAAGGVGAFFPGGVPMTKAIAGYKEFVRQQTHTTPLITAITFRGSVVGEDLGRLAPNLHSIYNHRPSDIARRQGAGPPTLPRPHNTSDIEGTWQPWSGITLAIEDPNSSLMPRQFRTTMGWIDPSDVATWDTAAQFQYAFELDIDLYNDGPNDVRPNCAAGTNSNFWAARTEDNDPGNLSTGTVAAFQTNFPPEVQAYFDTADYSNQCFTNDFSFGVGLPQFLTAFCGGPNGCMDDPEGGAMNGNYRITVGAAAGNQASSPMSLGVSKDTNDCIRNPNGVPSTQSWCVGLTDETDPATRHEIIKPAATDQGGVEAPWCVGYIQDYDAARADVDGSSIYGGQYAGTPPDDWSPNTYREGILQDPDEYCGAVPT